MELKHNANSLHLVLPGFILPVEAPPILLRLSADLAKRRSKQHKSGMQYSGSNIIRTNRAPHNLKNHGISPCSKDIALTQEVDVTLLLVHGLPLVITLL